MSVEMCLKFCVVHIYMIVSVTLSCFEPFRDKLDSYVH